MVGFIPPIAGLLAIIIGAMVLTPHLMVPILNGLGFAATGPVAGTFAAWIHSWIGIVAAGGLFAMAQAIGMGGRITALARCICCVFIGLVMLLVVLLVLLVLWVLWSTPLGSDLVASSRSPAPLPDSL